MEGTLFLRLRRVFALRGNRREARRDVVLGGPNDGDTTRILCDRRIGNRERERKRERKDGRGLEHSLVSLTKDARWLLGEKGMARWLSCHQATPRLPPGRARTPHPRPAAGVTRGKPDRRWVSLSSQL